jgi:hypothetical protein
MHSPDSLSFLRRSLALIAHAPMYLIPTPLPGLLHLQCPILDQVVQASKHFVPSPGSLLFSSPLRPIAWGSMHSLSPGLVLFPRRILG